VAKLLPAMVGPEGVQRWLAAERSLAVIEVDGDGGGRPVAHGFGIAQGQRQCMRSSVSDGAAGGGRRLLAVAQCGRARSRDATWQSVAFLHQCPSRAEGKGG
jgi:hypothetical protein